MEMVYLCANQQVLNFDKVFEMPTKNSYFCQSI
jgi:hypothetical protein